jgi:hypothetical protein
MTSETDEQFLDRLEATPRYNPAYRTLDSDRLFALARRGAAAAARIEQLEAALREIDQARYTGRCTINPTNGYDQAVALNKKLVGVMNIARAALEEGT